MLHRCSVIRYFLFFSLARSTHCVSNGNLASAVFRTYPQSSRFPKTTRITFLCPFFTNHTQYIVLFRSLHQALGRPLLPLTRLRQRFHLTPSTCISTKPSKSSSRSSATSKKKMRRCSRGNHLFDPFHIQQRFFPNFFEIHSFF